MNVTKTFLPPLEEYTHILKRAWKLNWITNRGVLLIELEEKLKDFLSVPFITITTNGTLPLQIAIKTLALKGEIITTPFSYMATSASIVWENCTPVYADIDPKYLTIDENKIEEKINSKTCAILATHVFGNPCHIETIEKIAQKYGLKVIYDAAHCFGVTYKGKSIFNYGTVSTCSFHATKIFHTGEGGCMITQDPEIHHKLFYHHNFGHRGPEEFYGLGINAKTSELQAAMGLAVLNHWTDIIAGRKKAVETYNEYLDFSCLQKISLREDTQWNYHYYPIIFSSESALLEAQKALHHQGIFPRRYFYPSLNTIPYLKGENMPISESIARRILCLPLFADLSPSWAQKISTLINQNTKKC